jgi:hypothetical protein
VREHPVDRADADSGADDAAERSLRLGLSGQPWTDEQEARVRAAVEAQWRASLIAAKRRRNSSWIGLAAAVATISILAGAWLLLLPNADAAVLGTVVTVEPGGLQAVSTPFSRQTLGAGAEFHTNQTLRARGSALIALEGGGTLRISRGTVIGARSANEIELRRGEVYLDLPPTQPRAAAFVVHTALGSVEHVGTQFDVTTGNREIRVRVREGQVRLRRASGIESAGAGTELIVPESGPVARHAMSTHGRQWSWVEALAPEFEIEDRPLGDFLQWAARETGRELQITDDRARSVVERTRLRGSVRGLTPLEALERVLRSTSLRFDLHEDAIRVSSDG